MSNNQKEKLLSNELIEKFLESDHQLSLDKNDKFIERASSLSYYLKSFSNIKRFLDYISLILKHTFNQQLSLIIPLNENGEIWKENITYDFSLQYYYIAKHSERELKTTTITTTTGMLCGRFRRHDSCQDINPGLISVPGEAFFSDYRL